MLQQSSGGVLHPMEVTATCLVRDDSVSIFNMTGTCCFCRAPHTAQLPPVSAPSLLTWCSSVPPSHRAESEKESNIPNFIRDTTLKEKHLSDSNNDVGKAPEAAEEH
ncbi:unnamed protein product [Pleuronectes platessa]|uniref:Uncharacterized protein n=1 Tax=Pleuronectes platessa TaxID=8262 RepID=A0A9N7ZF35_PLEPL|nr:unnamed protein product [Pleuronectes platessa]